DVSYLHNTVIYSFFVFNPPTSHEIYTLSLHDALPIYLEIIQEKCTCHIRGKYPVGITRIKVRDIFGIFKFNIVLSKKSYFKQLRSEEHTSELQSRENLVCRLLLEKKKQNVVVDCSVTS